MLIGDIFINNKSESLAEIKSVPCVKGCAMTYETDGHLMATSEKQFLEGWSFTGNNALTANHSNEKNMIIKGR